MRQIQVFHILLTPQKWLTKNLLGIKYPMNTFLQNFSIFYG